MSRSLARIFLWLLTILGSNFSLIYGAESAGTYAGTFLLIPTGVRSMGMGDAGVALPSGSNGAVYNPAGLVRSNYADISVSQQTLAADASLGFLGYAQPSDWRGLNEMGGVTVFGVVRSVNLGAIDVNLLNSDGSLSESKSVTAGQDLAVGAGYCEHFLKTSGGILGEGMHSIGLMGQVIQSKLAQTYSARALGLTLGYLGVFEQLNVGLSVANLGTKLKYKDTGDPLPVAFRAGVAVPYRISDFLRLWTVYDLVHQERTAHHRVGGELGMGQLGALRLGWRFEPDSFNDGPTFGFGLNLTRFFVDYAYALSGDLGSTHRILVGIRFSHHPLHFH